MGAILTLASGAIIAMIGCDTSNICSEDQKFLANIFGVVGMVIIGCASASKWRKQNDGTNKQNNGADQALMGSSITRQAGVQPDGRQPHTVINITVDDDNNTVLDQPPRMSA